MNILFRVCVSLSAGIILGFFIGGIKAKVRKKGYSEEQRATMKRVVRTIAGIVKYVTIMLLALGLVWCVYFLILAVCIPEQADYANNMAELIVAVLTVISIIFAFVEFIQHERSS